MPPLSRPKRAAQQILTDGRIKGPAVDVERIAKRYAHVIRQELPREVSGVLVPLEGQKTKYPWAIVVNEADIESRQRFTIAHELGHLLMHRFTTPHADSGFQVRFRDAASSEGRVREEIEANEFAAELLMPRDFIREALSEEQLDHAAEDERIFGTLVARLSELFDVSKQAMTVRLSTLMG
ncbi:MAG TPA: ImmA/IrrE family metallo-endopeptidase [Gemmatimonadaceae bacterium]|jgi:hypothetical protein|nr:ImmA/IrrE family metallo-endopeptidase [Gemmatimonadaceae bacterium]